MGITNKCDRKIPQHVMYFCKENKNCCGFLKNNNRGKVYIFLGKLLLFPLSIFCLCWYNLNTISWMPGNGLIREMLVLALYHKHSLDGIDMLA
jgi:hypothetical protein